MTGPSQVRRAAAAVLGVQALLGGVVGLALLGVARRHPRRGVGAAGLLTLVVAAGLVAAAVAVMKARPWARPVGLTLEGLVILVALSRLGVRPLIAAVSVALAVTAGVLLARPDDPGPAGRDAAGRGTTDPDPPYPQSARFDPTPPPPGPR